MVWQQNMDDATWTKKVGKKSPKLGIKSPQRPNLGCHGKTKDGYFRHVCPNRIQPPDPFHQEAETGCPSNAHGRSTDSKPQWENPRSLQKKTSGHTRCKIAHVKWPLKWLTRLIKTAPLWGTCAKLPCLDRLLQTPIMATLSGKKFIFLGYHLYYHNGCYSYSHKSKPRYPSVHTKVAGNYECSSTKMLKMMGFKTSTYKKVARTFAPSKPTINPANSARHRLADVPISVAGRDPWSDSTPWHDAPLPHCLIRPHINGIPGS